MFGIHISLPPFIGNAVKAAGRAVHSATHVISQGAGIIGNGIGKIPVVGSPLKATFDLTIGSSLKLADSVANGDRVDQAVLNNLKENIANAKTVAPYAQSVVSFVPGVGQGVSGVIGASLALANGQNIGDAVVTGIKQAAPGGPIGQAAFTVGLGALHGDRIETIALGVLPIPDSAKDAVSAGLDVAHKIASGQRVDEVLVQEAYSKLPSMAQKAVDVARGKVGFANAVVNESLKMVPGDAGKALKIGMAVGHAKNLQEAIKTVATSPDTLGKLADVGKVASAKNPVIAGAANVAGVGVNGFHIGMGLMKHSGVTPRILLDMRKGLVDDDKRGFDLAVATHVGMVTNKAPRLKDPKARAGFYMTMGMRGARPQTKARMMREIAKHPEAKKGATLAIIQVADDRSGLWYKIKKFVGLV